MDEKHANEVSKALGVLAWQTGVDEWFILFQRLDGKVVVITDEVICEYDDMSAFENSRPITSIMLH
jgi:hypothetical protein